MLSSNITLVQWIATAERIGSNDRGWGLTRVPEDHIGNNKDASKTLLKHFASKTLI